MPKRTAIYDKSSQQNAMNNKKNINDNKIEYLNVENGLNDAGKMTKSDLNSESSLIVNETNERYHHENKINDNNNTNLNESVVEQNDANNTNVIRGTLMIIPEEAKSLSACIFQANNLQREVVEDENYHVICDMLKIPCTILRVFGLYHKKKDHFLFKFYCILVLFVLWLNALKFFTAYSLISSGKAEQFNSGLVLKIISHIWMFIVAVLSTIIFINQECEARETKFINDINIMFQHHTNLNETIKRIKRRIYAFTIISLLCGMFNSAFILLSYIGPPDFYSAFSLFLCPFNNSDWAKTSLPYKLFIWLISSYTSFCWCLTIGLYACHTRLCIELVRNFDESFKDFVNKFKIVPKDSPFLYKREKTIIKENVNLDKQEKTLVCEEEFETLRLRHLKLCSVVRSLNVCYCEFIAVTLVGYVPIAFLLFYMMADWSGNCITGIAQILYILNFYFL